MLPPATKLSNPSPVTLRRILAVLAVGSLLLGLGSLSAAEDATNLRGDVPSGAEIRAELAELAEMRSALAEELASLERRHDSEEAALRQLGDQEQQLAEELKELSRTASEAAVTALVTGAPTFGVRYANQFSEPSDLIWSRYLFDNTVVPAADNIKRLRELVAQASDELLARLERLEHLDREVARVERELAVVNDRILIANNLLVLADAWDRADLAIAEGDYGIAPSDKWQDLRECESRHDYQAVSPSRVYRGAYQFDYATWRTVGGVGDPAAASPSEQDARARELYARRGHQPWPVCGRLLR